MTMRRFNPVGPIRRTLPPSTYVALAIVPIMLLEGSWFWTEGIALQNVDEFLVIRDGLIVTLLAAYGVYLVLAFHPLFQPKYLEWLERTPWCPGVPLPLGPVRLAFPDIVIAGGLALLLADPRVIANPNLSRMTPLAGILMFLQTHAVVTTATVWLTGPRGAAYVAAFLLALSARLSGQSPMAGLACLVAGIVTDHHGLNQSWHRFPWHDTIDWANRLKTGWKSMQTRGGQAMTGDAAPYRVPPAELGWPFGVLSPHEPIEIVSRREKLLLAALLGFWVHVLMTTMNAEFAQGAALLFLGYGSIGFLIYKLSAVGANHLPPINNAGRLLTMRWFIPRYDIVFVTPLMILFVV